MKEGQMIRLKSVIPIYFQIQHMLRRKIESGELKPGDRVDSERELAERFGVSLMTARQALKGLEQEGLIYRRRGKGSFVATPKIEMNQLLGFSEKMRMRGIRPSSKLLLGERILVRPEIAEKLRLDEGSYIFKVVRLRLGNDEPFALETSYVPEATCPGLLEKDLELGSLYKILESDYRIALEYADETIEAVAARRSEARLLAVKVGSPLLSVKQLLFGDLDRPILYEEAVYRADKYHVTIRLTRVQARTSPALLHMIEDIVR